MEKENNKDQTQDSFFLENEANAWFKRNAEAINKKLSSTDPIVRSLDMFNISFESVIDIGASNGYRLNLLKEKFNPKICVAVEPSEDAIADGQKRYPFINFRKGLASNIPTKRSESFDLTIVNFVLHWVDRKTLFTSVAEIDRCVSDNGYLVIGDFDPGVPIKVKYHHLQDKDAWTYKQDYPKLFTSSNLYQEVARLKISHKQTGFEIPPNINDQGAITILKKSLNTNYVEVKI